MIVRVMGEGQFRLGDDAVGRLNELDERGGDGRRRVEARDEHARRDRDGGHERRTHRQQEHQDDDDGEEEAQEALDRDDEGELDRYLDEMAGLVKRDGERLPEDDLSPSDAIVPPSDMTLEETKRFFSEQGLIPDVSP